MMNPFPPSCLPRVGAFFLFGLMALRLPAQTLFSYGTHKVDKAEFERAFFKNNTAGDRSEKAFREYLDLYIQFKLKVRAALDRRLDTLSAQKADLENFRRQIEGNYLADSKMTARLAREALTRSRKELHIQHIFIASPEGVMLTGRGKSDTSAAAKKASEVYKRAKAGENFLQLARRFSDDPQVAVNKGDLGFLSVFSLSYELENIVYTLPLGKPSAPFRSRSGYHIFYKVAERPSQGRIQAAQILLAFEPGASDAQKKIKRQKADSISKALNAGANFDQLALATSDDRNSFSSGGVLPAFRPGTYEPAFEQAAYKLPIGKVAPPIETSYGYHIIKKIGFLKEPADSTEALAQIGEEVARDQRMQIARARFEEQVTRLVAGRNGNIDAKTYYLAHLEDYDPQFKSQLDEFKEGNLLFEIMEREVWNKANQDTAALRAHFNTHAAQYNWAPSADAVFYTFGNYRTAEKIRAQVNGEARFWRRYSEAGTGEGMADSGRYELTQFPVPPAEVRAGLITPLLINPSDSSASFVYILKVYPESAPKRFEEARGMVANDYQSVLEKKWLEELRKKYPVKVNEAVLRSMIAK